MAPEDEGLQALRHAAHAVGILLSPWQAVPFDMDSLPFGRAEFTLTTLSSGVIRLDAGAGGYVQILGDFTYAGGAPTGGTIANVRLFDNGAMLLDLTRLPASPATLVSGLTARNLHEVEHTLFGGGDDVTGTPFGDTLDGFGGDDNLHGGDGADYIRGLDDNDVVEGDAGDDDLNGNAGSDAVHGGDGADVVRGGQGDDYVYGDAGDDPHVNGNLGDDHVFGGDGRDTLYGGQGRDELYGDAGDDQLSGDLGDDLLYGGAGADRFLIAAGGGVDWVGDFRADEGDRVQLAPGTTYTLTTYQGQVVIDLGGARLGLAGVASLGSSDWLIVG